MIDAQPPDLVVGLIRVRDARVRALLIKARDPPVCCRVDGSRKEMIEVTALWDIHGCRGEYVITVTADAFGQISVVRKCNNSGGIHVAVRETRVDLS